MRLEKLNPAGWRMLALGGPPEAPAWAGELRGIQERIGVLCAAGEKDFLLVGDRLQELQRRARQTAGLAAALVGEMLGGECERTAGGLGRMLAKSDRLQESARRDKLFLAGIGQRVNEVARALDALGGAAGVFAVLGVLVRIESSRDDETASGFGSVAQEVQSMAADIRGRLETAAGQIREIGTALKEATRRAGALDSHGAGGILEVRRQCEEGLRLLTERRDRIGASSQEIARRAEAASEEIAGLVTALQYQDITRQQMEHVAEAAAEMAVKLGGRLSREALADVAAAGAVQAAQLRQTQRTLGEASGQITAALASLAADIRATARAAAGEGRRSAGADALLRELYTGFKAVQAHLAVCEDNHCEALRAAAITAEKVGGLARAVRDIESVSIRMRRVALNAAVKAAHLGDQGLALGVLVARVQDLTGEAEGHTQEIVRVLGALTEAADAERHSLQAGAGTGAGAEEQLEGMVEALRIAAAAGRSRLEQVQQEASTLADQIDGLRSVFSAGAAEDSLRRLITDLEAVAGAARRRAGGPAGDLRPAGLDDIERRYTMESEREVQRALTGDAESAVTAGQLEGNELGANVELF